MKRLEVKYIRDGCKAKYDKGTECNICKTKEELQLHHYTTMTLLWEKYKKENGIVINDVEDIKRERDIFVSEYPKEIYEDTVTLCKFHHMDRLHKIYGKTPALHTAEKQKRWVEKQRVKCLQK